MQDTKLSSLYTTDTNENAYETYKHSSQENSKVRAMKSSRTTWRSLRHMNECMQLTPNLKWDTRLKQETYNIFGLYDFVNFFFRKLSGKENKGIKILNENSRNHTMLV